MGRRITGNFHFLDIEIKFGFHKGVVVKFDIWTGILGLFGGMCDEKFLTRLFLLCIILVEEGRSIL